jgi:lipoprotein signal peptidase
VARNVARKLPNPKRKIYDARMRIPPTRNFRSPAALACFLLTAVVGLALDQWSKYAAFRDLCTGVEVGPGGKMYVTGARTVEFIPGWLHFDVTVNQGAVFGKFEGQRDLFILISIAAVGVIFYIFANTKHRFHQIILGMLLAGVLGNLYDRLVFGYVRDMIHAVPSVYIFGHPAFMWIFNIADSLLCVGVFLMLAAGFAREFSRGRKLKRLRQLRHASTLGSA